MKRAVSRWLLAVGLPVFIFLQTNCFAQEPDPNAWDFGKVKQGEVAKHSFTLKNDSGKTLNITSVNTSCGCTVSEVKKKVLLPKESTAVEVKFNSKGYSGDVQQFAYVNTDRADNPIIRFTVKANVIK